MRVPGSFLSLAQQQIRWRRHAPRTALSRAASLSSLLAASALLVAHSSLPSSLAFQPLGSLRKTVSRPASLVQSRATASGADLSERPSVVFVLGGPGSGKGTQSDRISSEFGWDFLSAGDLLRAERAREGSELGGLIDDIIKSGKVVPSEVIAKLLEQGMREAGWGGRCFLIDGYPRSLEQLEGWMSVLDPQVRFLFCLCLDVSNEELTKRLLERGKTSGRSDDNAETVEKRLVTYEEQTQPVLDYFAQKGLLRRIDGERPPEKVWADVKELFSEVDVKA
mmetsp:Transcript_59500/g.141676  ORF Transcript_59500/g.141676 Transcript_59500/m.141676 type:complete len:280 (+) Transcript_59500:117-956(+)